MDTLKSLAELASPDPRHDMFVILDPRSESGTRPTRIDDLYVEIETLALDDQVPENVRSAFNLARMLWLYGWFYWPLYSAAPLHALLTLDLALGIRLKTEGRWDGKAHKQSLKTMLALAVDQRWVTDEGIAHARRMAESSRFFGLGTDEAGAEEQPRAVDNQAYARLLARALPDLRDSTVHPRQYWYSLPGHAFLTLENVHGLITQLFQRIKPGT